MVEDPSLEIVDTYSDWEYYSDDYYDDDPTIITKQKNEDDGAQRGDLPHKKKRKLSTLESIPSLSLGSSVVDYPTAMTSSFKGVMWRLPANNDQKAELYEPGKGEKVALLSDWRELFKTPLYRDDWFPNSSNTNGHDEAQRDNKEDTDSAPAPHIVGHSEQEASANAKYERYSPPPLAIENMDESISRQREKLSQPELPPQLPEETMVVADSDEELDEPASNSVTVEIPELDDAAAAAADEEKENANVPEKEEQSYRHRSKTSIRVEVPSLATAMKQKLPTKSTPPRKRGRKPKSSATTTESNGTNTKKKNNKRESAPKKSAQTHKQTPRKTEQTVSVKKRKKQAEIEEEGETQQQDDSATKRRSKRVASSVNNKKAVPDKKRTRTTSLSSSIEERGKRRRV